MSGSDRAASPDRATAAKQAHSLADNGRSNIPMWDSSDPERAPPPLPLNPGSQSPTTKANTSSAIAAAAQLIIEKARESTPVSTYTSNTPNASPERSLVKGSHHKRMQSLQTGSVKDLRSYLDNRSPERSPERPHSVSSAAALSKDNVKDYTVPERSSTPTPISRDPMRDTPSLRPSSRPPPRPILGENTPPSSTMLALQTMQVSESAFSDVTNRSGTPSTPRTSNSYDFASQLLNLTSIATNLQKEMANISRRSKDNATDLLSLKEATLTRDEDIRKGLRDLSTNVTASQLLGPPPVPGMGIRSASDYGAGLLDSKAYNSPPAGSKTWTLPRASSVPAFSDDGRAGSPSPYSVEGAASVAMLEKIIREMVTKEGQEGLLNTLSELFERSSKDNVEAAKKVEELAGFIKEKSESSALVPIATSASGAPILDLNFDSPRAMAKVREVAAEEQKPGKNQEILKLLQRIKDSIGHAGGATAEVKGLVRDMRGEVLGMGRELGRKLDQVSESQLNQTLDRSIETSQGNEGADEVRRAVEEGLAEIRIHLANVVKETTSRNEDAFNQLTVARSGVDGEDVYAAMKQALTEHGEHLSKQPAHVERAEVNQTGVLEAVKEGLKDFEPNIELQQFGLERDEILAVLKEGLEEYQSSRPEPASSGIDKGELYEMMQEALKDFQTISPQQTQLMREDILADVRQALSDYKAPTSGFALDDDAMRIAIIGAVKDGLENHGPAAPREIEISRDDLFDAVKASLDGTTIPFNSFGEQVLQRLHELVDGMRTEFKQYSAANGRDTEQVLDAVKDGLESLRAEIENYVDRAQDVTGKDEIVDTVKTGLEQLRSDVQGYCLQGSSHDGGKAEMLDYIKAEFEHLHETIGSSRELSDGTSVHNTPDLVSTLKAHMSELSMNSRSRSIGGEDDELSEEVLEAMRVEFDQLKDVLLRAQASDKSDLIETIQDSVGALHSRFSGSEISTLSGGMTEDLTHLMRQEFAKLKESVISMMGEADRDAIVIGVRQSIDDLRVQLSADQNDASAETLGAIKEELERFQEAVGTSMVLSNGHGTDASIVTIREYLEEIKEMIAKGTGSPLISDDLLEAMRGEFENIRVSISSNGAPPNSHQEVLDTVRVGLDDLRSGLEKKIDSPERYQEQQNELLDVMNEGLEVLRADVIKTLDKPLDMTVNYEILDTLKEGFTSLRAEMDSFKTDKVTVLKTGEMVLAEAAVVGEASRDINAEGAVPVQEAASSKHLDLERMEILLTQLQIKIEAMDASVQDTAAEARKPSQAEGTAMKHDLEAIESSLKDLQEAVLVLAEKELPAPPAPEGIAMKEDTDALETLLRNTKAQLEELASSDRTDSDAKDHVEGLISVTNDAIGDLKDRLDNTVAAKTDFALVELLGQDMKAMLEEVKEKIFTETSEEELAQRMTKADLDVLGILCTEIKTKITSIDLPDRADMPSKADMEQLQGLMSDFRESHDKLRDCYESDIAITARAFDDRKQEFDSTITHINEVKLVLMEAKDELVEKLSNGESGLNTLGETLKALEEKANGNTTIAELLEVVRAEFEKTHGSMEALKVDHEQNATISLEKQGEHKEAMITELGSRLDTLFDGLMSKYDDAQAAATENAKAMEEKTAAQDALFDSTKEMADDLKLSIDTLGTALTNFTSTYPDTMDKIAQDSKTVFNRVDDAYNKLDETQLGLQHEHTVTREEIVKVTAALQAVQSDLSEHNPRFMVSLKEVQALVSQHYEHSQQNSETAAQHAQAVRDLQDALKSGFEGAKEHHASQTAELKGALPALLPAPTDGSSATYEPYDDSGVHQKLDQLMGHAKQAADPAMQLERLDQIHEKVMATATEVSAFVALQAKQITHDHDNKQQEVDEVALLLERKMVQKDQIDDDITVLSEEKDSLRAAVEELRAEREALSAQKLRLAADVSSLETALRIRREELHSMDVKAETIERRMMEGVMNQSRLLLLAKGTRPPSPAKKRPQGRDLRVPSNVSAMSAQTTSTLPPLKANHALAMKSRPPMGRNGQLSNTTERRIMSLSQINHNVPTGASAFSPAPSLLNSGPLGLKRSHSVKTGPVRKPSWASSKQRSLSGYNKENETLSEEDEDDDFEDATDRNALGEDFGSEVGTESRLSFATGTDGERAFDERTDLDGMTPGEDDGHRTSYAPSDLTYMTGSYMTGSELDSRMSEGSTVNGVIGVESSLASRHPEDDNVSEDSEDDQVQLGAEREEEEMPKAPLRIEAPPTNNVHLSNGQKDKRMYAPPSDSGIGSDLPTATLSPSEHVGYFQG